MLVLSRWHVYTSTEAKEQFGIFPLATLVAFIKKNNFKIRQSLVKGEVWTRKLPQFAHTPKLLHFMFVYYPPVFSDYWNWRSQRRSGDRRLKRKRGRSRDQRWLLPPTAPWKMVPRYHWIPKIFLLTPPSSLLPLPSGWTICRPTVSTIPISLLIPRRKMSRKSST